mgnify:FL=1
MEIRSKMDRAHRAKQFMPFAALKGYEEALCAKEKIVVEKVEFSEEMKVELDRKLRQVEKYDIVTIIYFHKIEYLQVTGMVSRLDTYARILKVVNTKILFDDIYDIKSDKIDKASLL